MPDAVVPEKVKNISGVYDALIGDVKNLILNLDTGDFDITDVKGKVVKSIPISKGHDAAYVINYSKRPEDIASASDMIKAQSAASIAMASKSETQFAELQDDMLRSVETWRSGAPGTNKTSQSILIGRQQHVMSILERQLRNSQYSYREVLGVNGLKRRLYAPASNDERIIPFDVVKLAQTLNLSKGRVMPVE
jgi:hypothetical protein